MAARVCCESVVQYQLHSGGSVASSSGVAALSAQFKLPQFKLPLSKPSLAEQEAAPWPTSAGSNSASSASNSSAASSAKLSADMLDHHRLAAVFDVKRSANPLIAAAMAATSAQHTNDGAAADNGDSKHAGKASADKEMAHETLGGMLGRLINHDSPEDVRSTEFITEDS